MLWLVAAAMGRGSIKLDAVSTLLVDKVLPALG
jgi:hypothetical protein